jgi:hypothetical protein
MTWQFCALCGTDVGDPPASVDVPTNVALHPHAGNGNGMAMVPDTPPAIAALRRATLVPTIGLYHLTRDRRTHACGDAGVTVSNWDGELIELPDEPFVGGKWRLLDGSLLGMVGPGDYGPRSGRALDYAVTDIAAGEARLGVTEERLVGAFLQGSS